LKLLDVRGAMNWYHHPVQPDTVLIKITMFTTNLKAHDAFLALRVVMRHRTLTLRL
jgi:hypothetical protein